MIYRIEILSTIRDTRAVAKKNKLQSDGFNISEVILVDVYSINRKLHVGEMEKIASMLTNPVTQVCSIDASIFPEKFGYAIEIGYLPGVTDNIAATAKESIEDLLKLKFLNGENVYTSQIIFLSGDLVSEEINKITESLYNPLIQRMTIKNIKQFNNDQGMGKIIPLVKLHQSQKVEEVNLQVDDESLAEIGKKGIKNADGTRRGPLALSLAYMKAIQSYFKKQQRNPTDIELESIAQTWSEHCKHTIFADPMDNVKEGLFKTYIKASTEKIMKIKPGFCYSVFKDNSGAIEFDKEYLVTDKVDTHNSPSALDPFGGAITGIVGVNRDSIGFGLGAKPVINRYGFCFADPEDTKPLYKGNNLTQKMLQPKRIMSGVIDGVNSGGNCSGIPTSQGFMYFDKRYKGKPLVFVGTIGLIPKRIKIARRAIDLWSKKALPGDYIVVVGGRVGQDGIHGATFSSEAMDSGSPATAVQIGDPITQKKLSDAVVKEARDLGLYNSITDNGAGGLSCSAAEMAKESGGCLVYLEKVPLKYPGLSPWQIWISESQERMTLAVPKRKWKKFNKLMKSRGVEATVIGVFTKKKNCLVKFHGKTIMDIDMAFLHDGLPVRPMETTYTPVKYPQPKFSQPKNLTNSLLAMLHRKNIAGFDFLSSQYDHEVQGGSVIKPLQGRGRVNGEVSVTRPLLTSDRGVLLSQGLYPNYSEINTYHMAAAAIDTAIRNAVAGGADLDKLALLDNFCWCSPHEPFRLGQLKRAAEACFDYSLAYGTPFISGKDSMFNDFKGYDDKGKPIKISVPPTLLISSIAVIEDCRKTVSIDVKFPNDLVYIIGETTEELGGSEYFSMHDQVGNSIPKVNALKNKNLYKNFLKCIKAGIISSSISINIGGLATALAKSAIAGMLGMEVDLKKVPGKFKRDDYGLYSESQGRIIVTISPHHKEELEKIMKNNPIRRIGKVSDNGKFTIKGKSGKTIIDTDINKLLKAYKSTFRNY